jgi:hypothetical protein
MTRTVTSRTGKTYSYPTPAGPSRLHRCGKETLTTPELRAWAKSLVKRYGAKK